MMRFSHPGWRSLAGIVVSAVLLGLYARGGYACVLGFVCLVPWLLALDANRTVAAAARSGVVMSIAFVVAVFAWFGIAIGSYTGIGGTAGLAVILAAAPLLQPQLIAFALVRHIAGRRHGPVVRALAGASAWVAAEWLAPKLLGDTLGHGLYPSRVLRQIADVGGAAGITFLLIIVNEAIAAAVVRRGDGLRALIKPAAAAAAVVVLMAGYGAVRLSMLSVANETAGKPLRIGMVQSNIVDYERLRREMGAYEVVRHVLDTHYRMSREAIDQHQVDALLWSETVYPTTYGHPKSEGGVELDNEIRDFVTAAGIPLVFGTYDLDDNGEYNAAAFLEPVQADEQKLIPGVLGFYRKTDLFLFTEYLPAWLDGPAIRRWLPGAGAWQPGDGARVFPLRLADGREIPVMPMICLDDTVTGLGIDGARLGAQVILGMSNDSWFTDHVQGANLHLAVAAFRTLETRLPQMRVTANGISAVIDASGDVVASTAMGEQKLLIGEVSAAEPPRTVMVALGDWVGRAGLALLLLLVAAAAVAAYGQRAARNAVASSTSTDARQDAGAVFRADVALLSPVWRVAAGLLRLFARASLLWMGLALLLQDSTQTNPLSQMRMFAGLFLAPEVAAWCIIRAFAAKLRIEQGVMTLEQRHRRIEIEARDIAAVVVWTLPLPATGLWLRLNSGRRWSHGLMLADPAAVVTALIGAGAGPALAGALDGRLAAYARARLPASHGRLTDHPLLKRVLKFVVFPLVPALPAFRLHQHIAFGGTFGEYHTYGLQAYLSALAIWWVSWAISLVLLAAALRAVIEVVTLLTLALRPSQISVVRPVLELLGRLIYYVGVPAWLVVILWP